MSGDLRDGMTAIGNTEEMMIRVLALYKDNFLRPYLQFITLSTDISFFFRRRLGQNMVNKLILVYVIPVDVHRSMPLISLVPFNLRFHCFQG